jgi:uncharacterized membrane protein SpoIIM required for sporulation
MWLKVAIGIFIVELVMLFYFSTVPIPGFMVSDINNQTTTIAQNAYSLNLLVRAMFLFSNNFHIAATEFIPLFGLYTFASVMYNTALAIEVIGIGSNIPGPLVALGLLFEPHTWLELPAYALAATQSVYLVRSFASWRRFKFELVRTPFVFALVAVELFIAAIFESSEISLASRSAAQALVIPWIAFAALAAIVYVGRDHLLKKERPQVPLPPPIPSYPNPTTTANMYPIRYCSKCGRKISQLGVARFCDQCGERFGT